jgi:hypothetical protein
LIGSFIFWGISREAKTVTIQINVKDFRKQGLKLFEPSTLAFKEKISDLLKDKESPEIEALKPFSVVLENTSNKAVVGYWLKWEMIKPDGSIDSRQTGGLTPGQLMDENISDMNHPSLTMGYAIKPNSSRFISLALSFGENQEGTLGAYGSGTKEKQAEKPFQQNQGKDIYSISNRLITDLQNYTAITVSLDGVFFQDGTFIGSNSTNFFEKVQAHMDAKRELLEEILFSTRRNISTEEIFTNIAEIANRQIDFLSSTSSTTDYYNYYKKLYAEEILQMRKAMDSKRAIAMSLQGLRTSWVKLKKL